ncbi:MAG: uroporphyrinogen-III C-methyltransferase [Bermanella sp.]
MSDKQTPIPSANNGPTQAASAPVRAGNNKAIYLVATLFTLLLLAAVVFFQYRMEALVSHNGVLEHQITSLDQQSRSQLAKSIEQNLELNKITQMNAQLRAMQQTLNQIPGARMDDWKLAEVEYLLRLANQRVNLQHELSGAWALFDAANKILAALDDPALLRVREKIAAEMLTLRREKQLDRQGIYTQIQALKSQVHQQIQPPATFNPSTNQITSAAPQDDTLWQQLKSLVQVRYAEDAFTAPLNVQQYQILEHSLLLMLEQSQWALLKADQSLYDSSLGNAIDWLNKKLRHQQAQTLSTHLQQLKDIDIALHIPDVSASLMLLRQTLNDRTYAPTANAPKANVSKAAADSVTAGQAL